jgi:hypothetical protein
MSRSFEKILYVLLAVIVTLSVLATGYQTFVLKSMETYNSEEDI